jgi:hypothetical protein
MVQCQNEYEESSEALRTETVNTSAIAHTPKTGKWGKKNTPLQTMTKYEPKKPQPHQQKDNEKGYHSRLNSAVYDEKVQGEEVLEDIEGENAE